MVDVAREIAEIRATMRRAQRRARVDWLRARAIAAGRKVPPRRARRRFSVARINAALARATSIRDPEFVGLCFLTGDASGSAYRKRRQRAREGLGMLAEAGDCRIEGRRILPPLPKRRGAG